MNDGQPVKPAASVLLLRPAVAGFEVFTVRRAATMAFAGGMTAFPGGGVDIADSEPVPGWVGPDISWWAAALGVVGAGELVLAAVRELFEEVGVLLAGPDGEDGPGPVPPGVEATRSEIAAHRRTFASVLADHRLMLRSDLLRPWARWITPPRQSRRYDTFFFAAALPAGQDARVLTGEAVAGGWATPRELLAQYRSGVSAMLPPTVVVLTELAGHASLPDVLGTPRRVRPVQPEIVSGPGEPLRIKVNGVEIDLLGTGR